MRRCSRRRSAPRWTRCRFCAWTTPSQPPVVDRGIDPISLQHAIAAHDAVAEASRKAAELHRLIGSEVTLQILGGTGAGDRRARCVPGEPDLADVRRPSDAPRGARILTAFEIPELTASAQSHQTTLRDATNVSRIAVLFAAVLSAVGVASATLVIERRLRHALLSAESEQARLIDTTRAMQRRNDQFAALYQVGSEVSESLSMRYVVQTTVREARKLVGADVVAVRRVVNGALGDCGHRAGRRCGHRRTKVDPARHRARRRAAKRGRRSALTGLRMRRCRRESASRGWSRASLCR